MLEGVYTINPRQMTTEQPRNVNDEDIPSSRHELAEHISNPTSMTYCLLRIRFAEICRTYTDRVPLSNALTEESKYREITELNHRLKQFIYDLPLSHRRLTGGTTKSGSFQTLAPSQGVTVQRYLLTLHVYSLICRLHFPYFARAFTQACFCTARAVCLDAARKILSADLELEQQQIPFSERRLRLSSILYAILLASTVFAINLCLDPSLNDDIAYVAEVTDAFRLLQRASENSHPAAKVYKCLLQLLSKHQVHVKINQRSSMAISTCALSPTFGDPFPSRADAFESWASPEDDLDGRQGELAGDLYKSLDFEIDLNYLDFHFSNERHPFFI